MKKILPLLLLLSCQTPNSKPQTPNTKPPNPELIYHVLIRSFYDSNNDRHGDLKGLQQKLDYLQQLGVTSILMLPLYESIYYHNYFTSDFEKIDEEYGSMEDYLHLVKEIHRRGMKLYMDMETHYVTEDHPWFSHSYRNPASPYSEYILYNDPLNATTEPMLFNLTELKGYNHSVRKIGVLNLHHPPVKEYLFKLYKHWLDPNRDGNFEDGVDGYRFDHMMDNLDDRGRLTNLFQSFWKPLVDTLKQVNPEIKIVAEQSHWASLGLDYFPKADVDAVFAFRLAFEIRNFNKQKLVTMADSIFGYTPPGKDQFVFIENHDMQRFANAVNLHPGKLRVGAALNILIGGTPVIYYGQEIGMNGKGEWEKWGFSDAVEIPDREAFEWYKKEEGRGMAHWYKDSGPWWTQRYAKPDDGISVEEQINDPHSLWSFYRDMIALRKSNIALVEGQYETLVNHNDSVFSFLRRHPQQTVMVVVNFSGRQQAVDIKPPKGKTEVLWGRESDLRWIKPYEILVYSIH